MRRERGEPDRFDVRDVLELRLALARLQPGQHVDDLVAIALRSDESAMRSSGFRFGMFARADRERREKALDLLAKQSALVALRGAFFVASAEARASVVRLLHDAAGSSVDARRVLVDALHDPALGVRVFAIRALRAAVPGGTFGYDPEGPLAARVAAAAHWRERVG